MTDHSLLARLRLGRTNTAPPPACPWEPADASSRCRRHQNAPLLRCQTPPGPPHHQPICHAPVLSPHLWTARTDWLEPPQRGVPSRHRPAHSAATRHHQPSASSHSTSTQRTPPSPDAPTTEAPSQPRRNAARPRRGQQGGPRAHGTAATPRARSGLGGPGSTPRRRRRAQPRQIPQRRREETSAISRAPTQR